MDHPRRQSLPIFTAVLRRQGLSLLRRLKYAISEQECPKNSDEWPQIWRGILQFLAFQICNFRTDMVPGGAYTNYNSTNGIINQILDSMVETQTRNAQRGDLS